MVRRLAFLLILVAAPAHAADHSWVDTPGVMPPEGWAAQIAAEEEEMLGLLRQAHHPSLGEIEEMRELGTRDRDTRALYLFHLAQAARQVDGSRHHHPGMSPEEAEALAEHVAREVERAHDAAEKAMEKEMERAAERASAEMERVEAIQEAIEGLAEDFDELPAATQREHRQAMRRLAAELFELRQTERRMRLESMDARLEALRVELEAQERAREAIVDEHLEKLIREQQ